jgi:hypothetical protein
MIEKAWDKFLLEGVENSRMDAGLETFGKGAEFGM